ncbi:hypothetical protein CEXT_205931 [Caerostris extrusa]|uniref:Uncharacterized protein n=1 Tax=Caerostris extrusa TaxID=172846 RepID=A0AAV4TQD2_CAEEX|nr:hypothetical protein CEXT_205931 [Caerostris extrusa]
MTEDRNKSFIPPREKSPKTKMTYGSCAIYLDLAAFFGSDSFYRRHNIRTAKDATLLQEHQGPMLSHRSHYQPSIQLTLKIEPKSKAGYFKDKALRFISVIKHRTRSSQSSLPVFVIDDRGSQQKASFFPQKES